MTFRRLRIGWAKKNLFLIYHIYVTVRDKMKHTLPECCGTASFLNNYDRPV